MHSLRKWLQFSIGNCSSVATSRMCTCTDVYTSVHAFALTADNWASALHIQVEHIFGEGQRGPNWK